MVICEHFHPSHICSSIRLSRSGLLGSCPNPPHQTRLYMHWMTCNIKPDTPYSWSTSLQVKPKDAGEWGPQNTCRLVWQSPMYPHLSLNIIPGPVFHNQDKNCTFQSEFFTNQLLPSLELKEGKDQQQQVHICRTNSVPRTDPMANLQSWWWLYDFHICSEYHTRLCSFLFFLYGSFLSVMNDHNLKVLVWNTVFWASGKTSHERMWAWNQTNTRKLHIITVHPQAHHSDASP